MKDYIHNRYEGDSAVGLKAGGMFGRDGRGGGSEKDAAVQVDRYDSNVTATIFEFIMFIF